MRVVLSLPYNPLEFRGILQCNLRSHIVMIHCYMANDYLGYLYIWNIYKLVTSPNNDIIMGRYRVSNNQPHDVSQPFIDAQIKENIKALRHWPLCVEFTGGRWIPRTKASNAENVSIWWRHHGLPIRRKTLTWRWCSYGTKHAMFRIRTANAYFLWKLNNHKSGNPGTTI